MPDDACPNANMQATSPYDAMPGKRRDVICFSHLRWDFVVQRPQHLMERFARSGRVFYFEEPLFEDTEHAFLRIQPRMAGLHVVAPVMPTGRSGTPLRELRNLLDGLIATWRIRDFTAWYYTPMALVFSEHLKPECVVYDCMDELGNFKDAPSGLAAAEDRLLQRAHIVFTGGRSLYEAKRLRHGNVHAFPSSIDRDHFAGARAAVSDPPDQRVIAAPRLGFYGVLDERFDSELVRGIVLRRPDWQIVLIGPVVKIDPETLPRLPNVHYLGMKAYAELPAYLSGWDIAIMPFARNAATRFISPTKTLEYLAGGVRVVSTSIHDVVHPYGDEGLVEIADEPADFVAACERVLGKPSQAWTAAVDAHLAGQSWENTWRAMCALIAQTAFTKTPCMPSARDTALPDVC